MKRLIIVFLLVTQISYVEGATKTPNSAGLTKLTDWVKKVGRIYATAKKHVSGLSQSGEVTVPVYAYGPGGFTTAGYASLDYSNTNISASAGSFTNALIPAPASLNWGCPGSKGTVTEVADFGFYNTAGGNVLMFHPNSPEQICLSQNYGFASCLGAYRVDTMRASCVIGMRRVKYDINPTSYCGIYSVIIDQSALSLTLIPEDVCLGTSGLKTPVTLTPMPPCSALNGVSDIKAALTAYRQFQNTYNSAMPSGANYDLIELDAVLAQMQNGVELASSDLQGDENPPVAQNPWATQRPTLQAAGKTAHTGLVGGTLSESLKVSALTHEGAPADGVDVMFRVDGAPSSDWSFSGAAAGQPVYKTISGGLAETGFILGTASGGYAITAECPYCCPSTVAFSVIGKTLKQATALTSEICNLTDRIGNEFKNPFRVYAVNTVTGQKVPGLSVQYSLAGFSDINGTASEIPAGTDFRVQNSGTTDLNGYSRAYLKAGGEEGTYLLRATCADCEGNPEVICRGGARMFDFEGNPEVEKTVGANPYDKDPETGKALTPVLRITKIDYPNSEGRSFTTYDGSVMPGPENKVHIEAELLPKDEFTDQDIIRWTATDYPGDLVNSGAPYMQTNVGAVKDMLMIADGVNVPLANQEGRPGPLTYSVVATATSSSGKTITSRKKILKQDEIDKCRQEYFDLSAAENDLRISSYFNRYTREKFTVGVDGEIDPDYVRFIDCFAHVFPARAADIEGVSGLRKKVSFPIDIKSGYRSPRKNYLQEPRGKWNSSHLFGDGVDMVPKDWQSLPPQVRAARFKALWYNTDCPKILETYGATVMAVCDVGQSTSTYKADYNESNVFGLANCVHLGE